MAKQDSNFVYYITKKGDGIVETYQIEMRHVTYERVHNLRKSTHMQEEEGSIVNEYNVLYN
jgi:hypothetical protein